MRKRFEQQLTIEKRPIAETVIPMGKRSGPLPALFVALKGIFLSPQWNEKVFEILDQVHHLEKQSHRASRYGFVADFCIGSSATLQKHELRRSVLCR